MNMLKFNAFSLWESILQVDKSFLEILQAMEQKGDILAAKLLQLVNTDITTNVNYLRPSQNIDDIYFVPDSQVDKQKEKGVDLWAAKNIAKIGRSCRQILTANKISFTESEIETFVNNYKNSFQKIILKKDNSDIRLVKGEEIKKWYLETSYVTGGGELNSSCMRSRACQEYFNLYIKNPEVCQLIILLNPDDLLLGRALVWQLNNGEYYLDRIYTRFDNDKTRILDFFEDKFNSTLSYSNDDYSDHMTINLTQASNFEGDVKLDRYPYLDTFCFLDVENLILTNKEDKNYVYLELVDTAGRPDSTGIYSEIEDRYLPEPQAKYISGQGYISIQNTLRSDFDNDEYMLKSDAIDSIYGKINQKTAILTKEWGWLPKKDYYHILVDKKWVGIPRKQSIKDGTIPADYQPACLKNGMEVLVAPQDLVFCFNGSRNDQNIYRPEFIDYKANITLLYKVREVPTGITFREVDVPQIQKIGYYQGYPVIFQTDTAGEDNYFFDINEITKDLITKYDESVYAYTNTKTHYYNLLLTYDIYQDGVIDLKKYGILSADDIFYIYRTGNYYIKLLNNINNNDCTSTTEYFEMMAVIYLTDVLKSSVGKYSDPQHKTTLAVVDRIKKTRIFAAYQDSLPNEIETLSYLTALDYWYNILDLPIRIFLTLTKLPAHLEDYEPISLSYQNTNSVLSNALLFATRRMRYADVGVDNLGRLFIEAFVTKAKMFFDSNS